MLARRCDFGPSQAFRLTHESSWSYVVVMPATTRSRRQLDGRPDLSADLAELARLLRQLLRDILTSIKVSKTPNPPQTTPAQSLTGYAALAASEDDDDREFHAAMRERGARRIGAE